MKRPALVVVALACGCTPLPLSPFELDVSSNCNEVAVDMVWDDLDDRGGDDWSRVFAAVADAPGSSGAWLLVQRENMLGDEVLAVVHLGPDGVVVVDELNPLASAGDFSFVPGPTRGQAWLVEESTGLYQLRHYEAEPVPVRIAVSGDFVQVPPAHSFPALTCIDEEGIVSECIVDDWPRELVFFDGSPYVLSLPPSSGDASVDLVVGALSPALDYIEQQTLNFAPDCDQDLAPEDLAACEALKASMVHPVLAILGIQPDTRSATTSLAIYRETLTLVEGYPDIPQADLAFVVLGHDKLGHAAGNLVSEAMLVPPASPDDGAVVIDSRAMYVKYDGGASPVIVQKADLDDTFDTLTDELAIDISRDSTLLQLDEDMALGRITDEGAWEIVKLFPDAPNESRLTLYEPGSDIERVVFAGPGSFLVHEADGGPDLVRVACNDEPSGTD